MTEVEGPNGMPIGTCEELNRKNLCDIARCAFEVVSRCLERDQRLASDLRSKTATSRQVYREESITVDVATTLRERFPRHVTITLFTSAEESKTGADWYWRIESGDRALHARVQAKRVQRTEFGQQDEHGHLDIDEPQLQQLLSSTSDASTELPDLKAWLATYARISADPPCGEYELQRCRLHRHQGSCASHGPSLWIANAHEIDRLKARRLTMPEIIQRSVRLDCILPCVNRVDGQGPAAKGFVLSSGLPTYRECIAAIQRDAVLRSGLEGAMRIEV